MFEMGGTFARVCGITAVPAVAMALGSSAVSLAQPSETLEARLQRFSAGLLIGAVITEIFPILKRHLLPEGHLSIVNFMAAVLGFSLALFLMYSIKAMDLDGESDSEEEAESEGGEEVEAPRKAEWLQTRADGDEEASMKLSMWLARLQAHSMSLARIVNSQDVDREAIDEEVHGIDFLVDASRRLCKGAEPMDRRSATRLRQKVAGLIEDIEGLRQMDVNESTSIENQLRLANVSLLKVHSATERAVFRRWGPRPLEESGDEENERKGKIPVRLILAVVVDSIVDGMLIGLAAAVSATSGRLMAAATTFEMGFLGYSFAISIAKVARRCSAIGILAVPPLAMMVASGLAAESVDFLEGTPAFSGFIAFAMVALLFLVFQELLLEAHEKEGGEEWHISLWLYAGLLVSIHFDMIF
mmetsp:Transcript_10532/g.23186  ORF Transcript_10532/g.23186 Transcript_10532/m.23186 type:complete len:415 (+) Transcript_10532:76-1320(+)